MIRNDPYRFIVLVVAAILILVVSGDCLHALKLSVAGSDIAIKGAWYGVRYRDATGDGVTDDYAAINNAAADDMVLTFVYASGSWYQAGQQTN